ncbi:LytR C-terminal domain-containing protein [Kitasatospora terrestris]|uniref:Polydiglycosylphosphate transferase PdtA n=1 Tax=Kitasatospora terrestris TaxID=258051 RepID=A0ABP9DK94_9ACTN
MTEDQGWYGQQGQQYPQDPYHQQQPQYDQYGRPVYPQQQDPYYPQQQQYEQQQYDQPQYDQYGRPVHPQQPQEYYQQPYPQQEYYQPQPVQPVAQPQSVQPVAPPPAAAPPVRAPRPRQAEPEPVVDEGPSERVGGSRAARASADSYTTGEFTFVDEVTEESQDAIDWLKFAESRSEVRAERRRRLRNRLIGAAVALALVGGGVGGYLWWNREETAAKAAGGRAVNVVHLRDLTGKVTTALLVDDESGRKGSVLLLPDTLKLPSNGDSATTTVGQSLDAVGASATRDGLGTVLGAKVDGTWRLDTPFLQLLVAQLGGVKVDVNATVRENNKADGKVLAQPGKQVLLSGVASVAYATLQNPGETRDAQLARFGQVLEAVIRTMPTDLASATDDVHRMNSVADPSLPESALAGVLAQLAQLAKDGKVATSTLKTRPDGTLDEATAGAQVKEILGGVVQNAKGTGGSTRVAVVNASGSDAAGTSAGVQVQNAGLDALPASKAPAVQAASEIRYADDAKQAAAKSLAVSLGLPETAVKKVTDAQNADLVLVVGKDYQVPKTP